ncbi:phosphatidylserine decarboxylase [Tenacibaculum agarivorans]|uniref:phosphatidylserine decarboxylase n=1 Tax=Tenacibaculum agarivorans TaxID=1908389 RepID=UPI00094BABD2|nr:phosphatidylserine decarboxylase [Tenacibaculum agarivorans]
MSTTITPIILPAPIEWSTKEAAATTHIENLATILAKPANKQNYIAALAELSVEAFIPNRSKSIVKFWYPYLIGESSLEDFFTAWLTYTPTPASPGKYIEYWDYLVNTTSGLLLANDESFKPWFTAFLNFHGDWINSTSSTGTLDEWMQYKGTTAHPFNINDYEVPEGGFKSFNQFFLRNLKPGQRPLCSKGNPEEVIVAPCDGGIFYLNHADQGKSIEELKNTAYKLPGKSDHFDLKDALPGYGSHFIGGDLLDILLWFTDYHHFHAPVSGTIVHQGMYHGSYNYDFGDYDPKDFYAPNLPKDSDQVGWYEKLGKHQRYVWIINTEKFGLVAMVAIGFWGVGSIINAIEEKGDQKPTVEQGQYMGHFGYGGSSIVLAFNKDVDIDFKVDGHEVKGANEPTLMKVRQCLGKLI